MLNVQFVDSVSNDDIFSVEIQAVYDTNTFVTITFDSRCCCSVL